MGGLHICTFLVTLPQYVDFVTKDSIFQKPFAAKVRNWCCLVPLHLAHNLIVPIFLDFDYSGIRMVACFSKAIINCVLKQTILVPLELIPTAVSLGNSGEAVSAQAAAQKNWA